MENSNLSLRKWLMAITFISATKQGFSALELQRQMGFSRYQTVLDLYHKIRVIMGKRDDEYSLEDMVEYDEAFVTKATDAKQKADLSRGRGSEQKAIVAVMAESTVLEDFKTGELTKSCRYFKMKKIENLKATTVETTTINVKPASGQIYAFTPPVQAAPTNLSFSNVTSSSITLNWTDNSTNEAGFLIYRSSDGSNYSFDRQTAANSTSVEVTALSSNTNYFWKIYAVSVGAFSSSFTSASQFTLCITPTPPTVTSTLTYCQNEPASPLSASGSNLFWGGGEV